ncbi:LytR/AlgR family response regulator transcription factor [Chryseobacterium sp. PTM-20240506]|uniref:LytR/AlgR family response regulator transcription factor n=1 Tax=unclassified Chryseobacterium TaxID=2593645 RepID=UPI0023591E7C|nr:MULTISPECIES: response regulator transcription factor [unclassified Chryseobacterium]MDC8104337.1 response regulator transcription factor [Chryseobacterium sp. B21-037]MDQ1803947.1 response regulator transcription factor [Chryseobacterium sp. CKR4-1]
MINCIVVDDEAHAIELLALHIEQTPFLKLVGSAMNPAEALQILNTTEVDLIFLDIQMPGMSGVEFLPLLNDRYKVILTTAFREYALDGFDHNVVDYLLKPIFFPRFLQAVQRAQEIISLSTKDAEDDFIMVKTEYKGKLIKIKTQDIVYIEGKGKYVCFHTRDGEEILALLNIGGLENKLPGDHFLRIHKSFIIAVPFIMMIHGNLVQLEFTKNQIPIGQTYRESFMNQMLGKVITNKKEEGPE